MSNPDADIQTTPTPGARGRNPSVVVAHRYALKQTIGRGGVSEVYSATDEETGRQVAVKILLPSHARVPSTVERAAQEAVTMTLLNHPHIVPVLDMGIDPVLRVPFVVMERAAATAAQAIKQSPLPPEVLVRWGLQMLWALDTAHRRGVVHRDVKPANILIATDGRAMLADFGIAQVRDADPVPEHRAIGTITYMAPEQERSASAVDARADIYALGATLYALGAGKRPSMLALRPRDHLIWEALPRALREPVFRATRRDPEHRYPSAWAMASDLYEPLGPTDSGFVILGQSELLAWLREPPVVM